jgi:hypothetical protein
MMNDGHQLTRTNVEAELQLEQQEAQIDDSDDDAQDQDSEAEPVSDDTRAPEPQSAVRPFSVSRSSWPWRAALTTVCGSLSFLK